MISFLIGIGASYVSSIYFLKQFLNNKRPTIDISPCVAYSRNIKDGNNYHYFKFVNTTNAEIFDVKVELTFMKAVGGMGGQNLIGDDIPLNDDFFSYIDKKQKDDKNSLHAYRVFTKHNIEEIWNEKGSESFLRIKIIAKHSLTGLSRVFYKDYFHKNDIKIGEFEHGDSLNVV